MERYLAGPGRRRALKCGSPCLFFLLIGTVLAQQPTLVFNAPSETVTAGTMTSFWLNALNDTDQALTWSFPGRVECQLVTPRVTNSAAFEWAGPTNSMAVTLAPGAFAKREYQLAIPASMVGPVAVQPIGISANRLLVDAHPAPVAEVAGQSKTPLSRLIKSVPSTKTGQPFEPVSFFKEHIFPYEPFYFVAGTESPNAKFQISFKYQLLNNEGPLVQRVPQLKGFALGFTQVSLWDWNRASAPFFDSSYKPELLYNYEKLLGGGPTNWYRLDLQGGVQHESNGKDGDNSRSLNIAYLRPSLTLGTDEKFMFTLIPRAWIYLGDLSDNPDIANYRGYADLRAIIGHKGLQLSALGRMGNEANRGSVQLDLTYPLTRLWGTFSVYLHAQYFTGFGESLLDYNQRSSAFRAGFSLYR